MIINSFDDKSEAIINPKINEKNPKIDVCILTFSNKIEEYVLKNYKHIKIADFKFATGVTPIYQINYKGKKIAFFKTYVGAPACVGSIEDTIQKINTKKFVVFGGAGCLNKEISHGKIMIPTEAYRDEGTSYHYAPANDYIKIKNATIVKNFMIENKIPFVIGKTWTTDSFYRETRNNFQMHKDDGCISVEMESSAIQAMCDFRNLEFYTFFSSGDLLDSPQWDEKKTENELKGTQHDSLFFDIAIELAVYVSSFKV